MKDGSTSKPSDDLAVSEERMRRSLGMGELRSSTTVQLSSTKERHRFRQDGEVPVVMVGSKRRLSSETEKASSLETALRAERQAKDQVQQALQQAQLALRALQTQLAHAEIAYHEGLTTERQARQQAETAAHEALAKLVAQQTASAPVIVSHPVPSSRKQPAAQARRNESKPVQWWSPGWGERS